MIRPVLTAGLSQGDRASCGRERLDFFFKPSAQVFPLLFQVVVRLQVEPELWRQAEVAAQSQGRVRSDGALALDDFIDAARKGSAHSFAHL